MHHLALLKSGPLRQSFIVFPFKLFSPLPSSLLQPSHHACRPTAKLGRPKGLDGYDYAGLAREPNRRTRRGENAGRRRLYPVASVISGLREPLVKWPADCRHFVPALQDRPENLETQRLAGGGRGAD